MDKNNSFKNAMTPKPKGISFLFDHTVWNMFLMGFCSTKTSLNELLTKLGCNGGVISSSNSENSFTDTWLWRKSFSARSISLKWKPTDGLSGEPGQKWNRTKVTAWLSQLQTATSFKCWFPTKWRTYTNYGILNITVMKIILWTWLLL